MAFVPLALLHLSLLLFCSSPTAVHGVSATPHNYPPPPAQPPHSLAPPPHHHHHHHHHHPPTPSPTSPPAHPPHKPSTPPPSKPPTAPPTKPPAHPPHKPSTPPPSKPPSHPPTKPPSHPPFKPPTAPPTKPPSHPPVKPPTTPPVKPPSYLPPRKLVAVQGVVFCKSCKFTGIDTLMGAAPLPGAVVKLQCNNTKYGLVEQTKTDQNGYFFFMPQKLTTAAFHKCKVFLVSSPLATCSTPTDFHRGASGALLVPSAKPPVKPTPFQLFSVGPFAFEPHKKLPCHY